MHNFAKLTAGCALGAALLLSACDDGNVLQTAAREQQTSSPTTSVTAGSSPASTVTVASTVATVTTASTTSASTTTASRQSTTATIPGTAPATLPASRSSAPPTTTGIIPTTRLTLPSISTTTRASSGLARQEVVAWLEDSDGLFDDRAIECAADGVLRVLGQARVLELDFDDLLLTTDEATRVVDVLFSCTDFVAAMRRSFADENFTPEDMACFAPFLNEQFLRRLLVSAFTQTYPTEVTPFLTCLGEE